MNRKSAGLLIGAGAGIGLFWLIRRGLIDIFPPLDREIILTQDPDGLCRVTIKPKEVWLISNQKLTWNVTNNCKKDIAVSLQNWDDGEGSDSPAVDPVYDPDDPGQEGLERTVKAEKKGKIRSKGKVPNHPWHTFTYDVYLDGKPAADPIVKLIL